MIEIIKALLYRGDRYLVLLRAPNVPLFPEHWDLPGGTPEPGEDPRACVEREITEETGLTAKALGKVATFELDLENTGSPTHRFTIYDTDSHFDEVRISAKHVGYRWMTRDEILDQENVEPFLIKYFEEDRTA
jgi:8-oxo-dGTP diphosphatase